MSEKEVAGRGNKKRNQEGKEQKSVTKANILTLNEIKITVAKLTISVDITRHSYIWLFSYSELL